LIGILPSTIRSEEIRQEWIRLARARGLQVKKLTSLPILINNKIRNVATQDAVYDINGIVTNIKVADEDWFSIGNRTLENIDVFVFICNDSTVFYSILVNEMKKLAEKTPPNSYDQRREFHIFPSSNKYPPHTYYSSGGTESVSTSFQNWDPFRLRPRDARVQLTQRELIEKARSITYHEMCRRAGGIKLQHGMNFRPKGLASVFLMNSSAEGKYPDLFVEGKTIIYQGHDVRQLKSGPDSKKIDQQPTNKDGSPTPNGLFYQAARRYKESGTDPEIIQVYEKRTKGEWLDRGLYKLVDAYPKIEGVRTVYKFKLEPNIGTSSGNQEDVVSEDEAAIAIKTGNTKLVKDVLTSESQASTSRRNGQDALRKLTLVRYANQCALCDVNDPQILVASHIIPWSEDEACRGALANVICLCSIHDRLFEKGRITIGSNYEVRFSDKFVNDCSKSNAYAAFRSITRVSLRLPSSEPPDPAFLKRHRESFD
jgi:hypothetical protein